MASGKTTIGNILAGRLHYEFMDLDTMIENEELNKLMAKVLEESFIHKFDDGKFSRVVKISKLIELLSGQKEPLEVKVHGNKKESSEEEKGKV